MKPTIKIFVLVCALAALSSPAFAHKSSPAPKGDKVAWKDVPQAAQAAIQSSAAGGKVTEVSKEIKNGVTVYRAEVKGTDGNFSKVAVTDAGKVLKVKADARNKHKHRPLLG